MVPGTGTNVGICDYSEKLNLNIMVKEIQSTWWSEHGVLKKSFTFSFITVGKNTFSWVCFLKIWQQGFQTPFETFKQFLTVYKSMDLFSMQIVSNLMKPFICIKLQTYLRGLFWPK